MTATRIAHQVFQRAAATERHRARAAPQGTADRPPVRTHDRTSPVLDAAIIGAAQKVEHYEIAGYGTTHSHALQLGELQAAALLEQTLEEEMDADQTLTDIAEDSVNALAEGQEYDEEEEEEVV